MRLAGLSGEMTPRQHPTQTYINILVVLSEAIYDFPRPVITCIKDHTASASLGNGGLETAQASNNETTTFALAWRPVSSISTRAASARGMSLLRQCARTTLRYMTPTGSSASEMRYEFCSLDTGTGYACLSKDSTA